MPVFFFVLTGRNETFPSPPPESSVTHELTSPSAKKKKKKRNIERNHVNHFKGLQKERHIFTEREPSKNTYPLRR